MTLGIVTGLAFEAGVLTRAGLRVARDQLPLVSCAGMGRDAARKAAQDLIGRGATALLSFGIAGGLDTSFQTGTIVVGSDIRAEGLPTLSCDRPWTRRLLDGFARCAPLADRPLAYAPVILVTATDKAGAFAATHAAAADMESYGIGEAAGARGLPFAALRVIADAADETLPEAALHAMSADGFINLPETIFRALSRPQDLGRLMRLGRRTAYATRRMGAAARLGMPLSFFAPH